MAYIRTYNSLSFVSLTEEGRSRTYGYWYCVSDHGTALTAFRTLSAFERWLELRCLTVEAGIPDQGTYGYQPIAGSYCSAMHMDRVAFDQIQGVQALQMSNGQYTLGKLASDADGMVCEHVLNPNVHDRPCFDHAASRALEDAGNATQLPPVIAGVMVREQAPYQPEKLAIERKRFSVTQGEVLLTYDGERIEQYGDKIELCGGQWQGIPDAQGHEVAQRTLAQRGLVSGKEA
jgi:hypothetical protein